VSDRAPDYHAPPVGWRVWVVVEHLGRLRLASVLYQAVWPVRTELVADCRAHGDHSVPHVRCLCGIYGAKSLDSSVSYFDGRGAGTPNEVYRVVGEVSLWGSVIEGDRGLRASRGYPRRLYVPSRSLAAPATVTPTDVALELTDYGVPVELLDAATKSGLCAELSSALADAA
jgi:hypothetical protein